MSRLSDSGHQDALDWAESELAPCMTGHCAELADVLLFIVYLLLVFNDYSGGLAIPSVNIRTTASA